MKKTFNMCITMSSEPFEKRMFVQECMEMIKKVENAECSIPERIPLKNEAIKDLRNALGGMKEALLLDNDAEYYRHMEIADELCNNYLHTFLPRKDDDDQSS